MANWVKALRSPYLNIGKFLVLQQVVEFIGIDNPAYLNLLRYLYIGAQLLVVGLNLYIIRAIKSKNDQTLLKCDDQEHPEQLLNIAVKDYDLAEVKRELNQSGLAIHLTVFQYKFNFVSPFVMEVILGFRTVLLIDEVLKIAGILYRNRHKMGESWTLWANVFNQ